MIKTQNAVQHFAEKHHAILWQIYIFIAVITLSGGGFIALDDSVLASIINPNLLYFAALLSVGVAAILYLMMHYKATLSLLRQHPLLIAFFLWCVASLVWSLAPITTIKSLIGLAISTSVAIAMTVNGRFLDSVKAMILAAFALSFISVSVYFMAPSLEKMTGLFSNRNLLIRFAFYAALFAGLLCAHKFTRRNEDASGYKNLITAIALGLICLTLFMVVEFRSFTAKLALILVVISCIAVMLFHYSRTLFYIFSALAIIATVMVLFNFQAVLDIARESQSLANRMHTWTSLLALNPAPTIQGAGLGAFWDRDIGLWKEVEMGKILFHSHNSIIEIYLDLGLIGVLLISALIAKMFYNYAKVSQFMNPWQQSFVLAFAAVFVLYNMTENSLLPTDRANLLMWAIFVIAIIQPVKTKLNAKI